MRNLRRKSSVRRLNKSFNIIVATVGVAWFWDLLLFNPKKKIWLIKKSIAQIVGNLEE